MEDLVIQAAKLASAARLTGSNSVSDYTRNAQAIAKAWRKAVHDLNPDRFLIEALVDPELDQKIDVLDQETHCAYEFKVSGIGCEHRTDHLGVSEPPMTAISFDDHISLAFEFAANFFHA